MVMNGSKQHGLTLIELMIAVTLSLLIIAALASLYINSARSYREDDQYARMLENGRFAVRFLADDLQMADFWGYYMLSDDIEVDGAIDSPCSNIKPYSTTSGVNGAVELIDDLGSGTNCATLPTTGSTARGLLIRRAGGPSVREAFVTAATPEFETDSDRMYLEVQAELKQAEAFKGSGSNYTIALPDNVWEYRSVVYYIDSATKQLCRQSFAFSPPQDSECLVGGIADAELLWSIDTSGNGQANLATRAPTTAQLRFAVGVRICLLLESEKELRNAANSRSYTLCGATPVTFNDGHFRRVFEKNVELRNASNAILFRSF